MSLIGNPCSSNCGRRDGSCPGNDVEKTWNCPLQVAMCAPRHKRKRPIFLYRPHVLCYRRGMPSTSSSVKLWQTGDTILQWDWQTSISNWYASPVLVNIFFVCVCAHELTQMVLILRRERILSDMHQWARTHLRGHIQVMA